MASEVHGAGVELSVAGGGSATLDRSALIGGETALSVTAGSATVTESLIAGATLRGVSVVGEASSVELSDLLVDGVRSGDPLAAGIYADEGATLHAERLAVVGAGGHGVVDYGSELALRDVAIIDAGVEAMANSVGAMLIAFDAHVEALGLAIEGAQSSGVTVFQSSGYIEDLRILGVENINASDGLGMIAGSSHVAVKRALVRDVHLVGFMTTDPQGQLRLEDVRVANVTTALGAFGRGLAVQSGAKLMLRRVHVSDVVADGIFVASRRASVVGSDVVLERIQAAEAGALLGMGIGVHAQAGAFVDLTRCEVHESQGLGMALLDEGTLARFRDLLVESTQSWIRGPLDETKAGRGIDLEPGATLVLERARLVDNRDAAIVVSPGTDLHLERHRDPGHPGRRQLTAGWPRARDLRHGHRPRGASALREQS